MRRTDGVRLVPVFITLSVLEATSVSAQKADIDLTPTQATVYVSQCVQFQVTIAPPQPNTVDITVQYSDPSRLGGLTLGFPIYPPAAGQYFHVCGTVAGTEAITITVALPTALGGATDFATVAVINPVPQPHVISPSSVPAGSAAFDLHVVQGRPLTFSGDSQILWNGVPKPTTLEPYQGVCPGICPPPHLRTRISAEDVSIAGTAQVVVRNPPPGGGESAPLTFEILPGLQSQSVPSLSPRFVVLLAVLLAVSGAYRLRNAAAP